MNSTDYNLQYRYPGVKPFTTEEQHLFFGRDKDIDNLFNLIFVKQTVVLYSKSGYGKSSLINAGIIPKLKTESSFAYFLIRFNNFSEKEQSEAISPIETVRSRLQAELLAETATALPLDSIISNENSFWYLLKAFQWQHQQSQFIFFFDQFEELFTYPQKQIDDFSDQLAQLLYPSIPIQFKKRMIELDELNGLVDDTQDFLFQRPDIKIVFSIRSDRLSLLDSLSDRHPTILQNCYELNALNRSQAVRAITEPAYIPQGTTYISPDFDYTPDAINAILDGMANPSDGKIESATLQIICRYIEDQFVLKRHNFTVNREQLGNITDIFQQYYEGILNRLSYADRQKAQYLIEDQLIDNGRRNTLSETYISKKFSIDSNLLTLLEKTSLLRKERDANGRLLYEVGHDTLVEAIERVATSRREVEEEAKRRKLEQEVEEERARIEQLQYLTEKAQYNEQKAKYRSRLTTLLALIALVITAITIYLWINSTKIAREAKALFWASESDKLYSAQAIRLLEVSAKHGFHLSAVYDRLTKRFNEGDKILFTQKDLYHEKVSSAQFSPDGKWILSISSNEVNTKIWDIEGRLQKSFTNQTSEDKGNFSPDGCYAIVYGIYSVNVLDLYRKVQITIPHKSPIVHANFSPDSHYIVTTSRNNIGYLWDIKGKLHAIFPHNKNVSLVDFVPDNKLIVSIASDNIVRLWSFKGEQLAALQHNGKVNSVNFSPDNKTIATASDDKTAKCWNFHGKLLLTLPHKGNVSSIKFSPDGQLIMTNTGFSSLSIETVHLWNRQGKLISTLPYKENVSDSRFSPTGKRILVVSYDRTGQSKTQIYDSQGNLLKTLPMSNYLASFSPGGDSILTVSTNQSVLIWNLEGKLLATLPHDASIQSAQFSPNGYWITSISDNIIKLWDLRNSFLTMIPSMNETSFNGQYSIVTSNSRKASLLDSKGKILAVLAHDDYITSSSFSVDGKFILTVSLDKTIKLWTAKGNLLSTFAHKRTVTSAKISSDNNWVLSTSNEKLANLWNLKTKRLTSLDHKDIVFYAEFLASERKVITASRDNIVKIWNLQGKSLATIQAGVNIYSVSIIELRKNEKYIVIKDNKVSGKLYDLTGEYIMEMEFPESAISASFSSNGKFIVTTISDSLGGLWNLQGKLLAILPHKDFIHSIFFSVNNKQIITVERTIVKIWNLRGDLQSCLRHLSSVSNVIVSPLGDKILTISGEKIAHLWNVKGKILANFPHKKRIITANFSSDNNELITVSQDSILRVWNENGNLLLKLRLYHNLEMNSGSFMLYKKQILAIVSDSLKIWNQQGNIMSTYKLEYSKKITFSPNKLHILTLSSSYPANTLKLWDIKGRVIATLSHVGEVLSAEFSEDGNWIVTASQDGVVKIWDLTGKLMTTLSHQNAVYSARLSSDNSRVLTSLSDKTICVWYTAEGALKWLHEHNDKVPLLSESNKKRYEVEN